MNALGVGAEPLDRFVLGEAGDRDDRPRATDREWLEDPLVGDPQTFEAVANRRVVDGRDERTPRREYGRGEVEEVEQVSDASARRQLFGRDALRTLGRRRQPAADELQFDSRDVRALASGRRRQQS